MAKEGTDGGSTPPIEPHPLVEALIPDPAKPRTRTVRLAGFPGRSPEPDATRLWLDLDFTQYVDVPNEAIRHSRTLDEDSGTMVWVDASATLRWGVAQSVEVQADFLGGSITDAHLGQSGAQAAAAAAGMAGAQGPGAASVDVNICAQPIPPSIACPSIGLVCQTRVSCFVTCRITCFQTCFRTCHATCFGPTCFVTCFQTCFRTCHATCFGPTCFVTCFQSCNPTCFGPTCFGVTCFVTCSPACRITQDPLLCQGNPGGLPPGPGPDPGPLGP